jgi:tRNA(Ile)-lysidine synthase
MVVESLGFAVAGLGCAGQRILVAVSGGVDSCVLLHGLQAVAPAHDLQLCVGHVNHGLRGQESDEDEREIGRLAEKLALPLRIRRVEPHSIRDGRANRERPTLQEAARVLRYAALEEMAAELGAECIATAHNLDDQAETVLMRLLRGTGPDGLGGIPERSPDGRIVRPLLQVPRAEILAYAAAQGVEWREDSSNRDGPYTRNRLRQHWLPGLASEFNPQLLRVIGNLAEAQRRESEWIGSLVDEAAARLWIAREGGIELVRDGWEDLPEGLARRLAHRLLGEVGAGRDVTRVHIERVLGFLRAEHGDRNGAAIELPGGLRLLRCADAYRLERRECAGDEPAV